MSDLKPYTNLWEIVVYPFPDISMISLICFKFRLLEPLTDRMQLHFCHGRKEYMHRALDCAPLMPLDEDGKTTS